MSRAAFGGYLVLYNVVIVTEIHLRFDIGHHKRKRLVKVYKFHV